MRCRACQHENRDEARFCEACGAKLAAAAGRGYTPPHLAQQGLTTPAAIEGERKQVTVLFCDLANSTAIAQAIGADAMHRLLNAFFELALAEVHAVGGTINQFLGDGFMALFGAPIAHEDHVRRALQAAAAIRDRLHAPHAAGDRIHAPHAAGDRPHAPHAGGDRQHAPHAAGDGPHAPHAAGDRPHALHAAGDRQQALHAAGDRQLASQAAGHRPRAPHAAGDSLHARDAEGDDVRARHAAVDRLRAEAASGGASTDVAARMGVHTGAVVVGSIGDHLRLDYTAVGDTTNIAARLQALAAPGEVWVSGAVHAVGEAHFDFASRGRQTLKGIREPVAAWVLGRAQRGGGGRRLGIGSALVGRDAELALLDGAVAALAAAGRGGTLVVTGEPGAGKSRLLTELRRRRAGDGALWLEGRSLSFGRSLSYWPFIEVLKSCFDIGEDDAEDVAWRRLVDGVGALFGDRAGELLPYLATVLALKLPPEHEERVKYLDGQALKRQVFLCMRQLFEQRARIGALVLLLEDWHWADQSSIELAEHLLPLTAAVPLLAVFTTRAEPAAPAARIRAAAAPVEMTLAPLGRAESAALVANLVGAADLPPRLSEQILRKTDGNPFFIEEVIRSLLTDGVLARDDDDDDTGAARLRLVRDVDTIELPDTVQGLLLARIDRLDDDAKQALKLASVIGRAFYNRVLQAISATAPALDASVAELEHAELIRERQRVPEIEYVFKHALVHEAAYGSILAANRRAIHGRVAQAIETLFEGRLDEFTSLLAHHYTNAEDWQKAQAYLFKAGDQAGRMAADTEALDHFRRAEAAYVKAYGDRLSAMQRAQLARKIGSALFGTAQYEEALTQCRRALGQLGVRYPASRWGVRRAIVAQLAAHAARRVRARLGRPHARALDDAAAQEISLVCHQMSWLDYFLDKERMLLDCLLELRAGELSAHAVAESRGLAGLGFGLMTFDLRGLARRYHRKAIGIAERTGNPSAVAFAWFSLGFLDLYDGRFDDCDRHCARGGAAYREAGDLRGWGGAVLMRAFAVLFHGDLAQTAALGAGMIRAGQDAGDPQLQSWGTLIAGYAAIAQGPLDAAAAMLDDAVALAARIGAFDNYLYQAAVHAKCLLLLGQLDAAEARLAEALRVMRAQKLNRAFDHVELLCATAAARLARAEAAGDRNAALREADRAVRGALAAARRQPGWLAQAERMAGTLAWLQDRPDAARGHWCASLALAERDRFPLERARTLLEQGRRTADAAAVAAARALFDAGGAAVDAALAARVSDGARRPEPQPA